MIESHLIIKIKHTHKFLSIDISFSTLINLNFLHIWIGDSFLSFLVQIETKTNPLIQLVLGLVSDVEIAITLDLEHLVLVIDYTLQNSISQSLGDHEFHITLRNVEFASHI